MKRVCVLIWGMIFIAGISMAQAQDSSKALKASNMVIKAVAFYNQNGLGATIDAVNDPKGQFVDGEYYIFIHTFEGVNIARGDGNTKRLGSSVLDDKDPSGKLYVQEMIKKAKEDGGGWETYGFKNAKTGKIQTKHSYFKKIEGALIGCGYFD